MKLKPFIALTAFAASMSAFAQAVPAEQAPTGRKMHTQAERQALRKDVQEYHRHREAPPHVRASMPTGEMVSQGPDGKGARPNFAPVEPRNVKREYFERRRQQHEAQEARTEKREERQSAKEARKEKREDRRERRRQRGEHPTEAVVGVSR